MKLASNVGCALFFLGVTLVFVQLGREAAPVLVEMAKTSAATEPLACIAMLVMFVGIVLMLSTSFPKHKHQ